MSNIAMALGANTVAEDRVRANTEPGINARIDSELERRIRWYATQDARAITERIQELDREWDIERALEANAAGISILGFVFGVAFGRKWLVLPLAAAGFLMNHAIKGWCPPVPLLRRAGFRTRFEIEQERYSLKMLRGDFDGVERKDGKMPDAGRVVSATQA